MLITRPPRNKKGRLQLNNVTINNNNFAYKQGYNNSNYDKVCVQLTQLTLSYIIINKTKHIKEVNLNIKNE